MSPHPPSLLPARLARLARGTLLLPRNTNYMALDASCAFATVYPPVHRWEAQLIYPVSTSVLAVQLMSKSNCKG